MSKTDTGSRLQLKMHLTAFGITVLLGAVVDLFLGLTVLESASDGTASLVGLAVAAGSLLVGYGIALYRLFKETR